MVPIHECTYIGSGYHECGSNSSRLLLHTRVQVGKLPGNIPLNPLGTSVSAEHSLGDGELELGRIETHYWHDLWRIFCKTVYKFEVTKKLLLQQRLFLAAPLIRPPPLLQSLSCMKIGRHSQQAVQFVMQPLPGSLSFSPRVTSSLIYHLWASAQPPPIS